MKKIFLLVYSSFILHTCHAQTGADTKNIGDNSELKKLVLIDQQMRQSDTLEMEPIDKKHREIVMSFLANGMIQTNEDKLNAALILQHTALTLCNDKLKSISPENYLLAYYLSKNVFESGDIDAAYMTAATYDRYLLYTEGFQKYGTQRIPDEVTGEEVWAPIDTLTTDEERAKYHVPSLKELSKEYKIKQFPGFK